MISNSLTPEPPEPVLAETITEIDAAKAENPSSTSRESADAATIP